MSYRHNFLVLEYILQQCFYCAIVMQTVLHPCLIFIEEQVFGFNYYIIKIHIVVCMILDGFILTPICIFQ